MDGKNLPKQVIVMRKDLGMRKGKMIAQACHSSMLFILNRINLSPLIGTSLKCSYKNVFKEPMEYWVNEKMTKVCLGVESEEELLDIYEKAQEAELEVHLVTDEGLTDFHGIPTNTCLAIGPDYPENIDKITGNLKLL